MDVPHEIVLRNTAKDFLRPLIYDLAFGLFSYVILFFILVSLVLPALAGSYVPQSDLEGTDVSLIAFWSATAAILFVVHVFFADFTLKSLKHDGLRAGILAAALTVFLLIAMAPIIFSDDFTTSSVFNLSILLLAPFLGQIVGGWFVARRAA